MERDEDMRQVWCTMMNEAQYSKDAFPVHKLFQGVWISSCTIAPSEVDGEDSLYAAFCFPHWYYSGTMDGCRLPAGMGDSTGIFADNLWRAYVGV